jgi:hypothetical protein
MEAADSHVRYGTSSGDYPYLATGSWMTYFYKNYSSGAIHTVYLTDLSPLTTYYYRCGSESDGWSDEFSFTTAPPTPDTEVRNRNRNRKKRKRLSLFYCAGLCDGLWRYGFRRI